MLSIDCKMTVNELTQLFHVLNAMSYRCTNSRWRNEDVPEHRDSNHRRRSLISVRCFIRIEGRLGFCGLMQPLLALRVVRIDKLASVRALASRRASPALATALSPLGSAAGASRRGGSSRGAGRCSRGRLGGSSRSSRGRSSAGSGSSALGELEAGRAGTLPRLDGENLEVLRAELHAEAGPSVEVVLEGDGAAGAGGLADAEVRRSAALSDDWYVWGTHEMYCWNVDVPWMEGWFVCWCCQTA